MVVAKIIKIPRLRLEPWHTSFSHHYKDYIWNKHLKINALSDNLFYFAEWVTITLNNRSRSHYWFCHHNSCINFIYFFIIRQIFALTLYFAASRNQECSPQSFFVICCNCYHYYLHEHKLKLNWIIILIIFSKYLYFTFLSSQQQLRFVLMKLLLLRPLLSSE
jgi:hypothetical protein